MSSLVPRPSIVAPRWDLGIRGLAPELRAMVGRPRADDFLAAVGGMSSALALALFLAVDVGASPIRAVVALGIGGLCGALLSGTRVASGGPALAAGVALTTLIATHDGETIAIACLVAGLLQLALGGLGVGRLAALVPLGVSHGLILGIGASVALHALPHVAGIATPADLDPLEVLDHLGSDFRHASPMGLGIAVAAVLGTATCARWAPRVPFALLALFASAGATWALGLDLPRLGDVLEAPPFAIPHVPRRGIAAAIGLSLGLAFLTTLETLVSSSAERTRDLRHRADGDQDLIASGVASILCSLSGGLPVSTSIARGELHRDARPGTRASAVLVAVGVVPLGLLLLALGPFVPIAAIGGAGLGLAIRLLDPRILVALRRTSAREAAAAVGTACALLLFGLGAGVQTGLAVSLVVAAWNVARARYALHVGREGTPHQVTLSGPLTFLVAPTLAELDRQLEAVDVKTGVIVDLRGVPFVDATAASRLIEISRRIVEREGKLAVLGASPQSKEAVVRADPEGVLEGRFAISERELDAMLGVTRAFRPRAQLLAGLERFRRDLRQHYTPLLDQLADGQSPHTLLVTCVDSRIQPELLTGAHPGELFIVRCLGGLVSPLGDDGLGLPAEAAAVEYAVGVLGVRNLIVCGHSQCGAIKALRSPSAPPEYEALNRWMSRADIATGDLHDAADVDDAARAATARQLDNLRTILQVRSREKKGELHLSAWFYDVAKAEILEWNEEKKEYAVAGSEPRVSLRPPTPGRS